MNLVLLTDSRDLKDVFYIDLINQSPQNIVIYISASTLKFPRTAVQIAYNCWRNRRGVTLNSEIHFITFKMKQINYLPLKVILFRTQHT